MKPKTIPLGLTRNDEFAIAAEAGCDPRTVHRALLGQPVRSMILKRIHESLRWRGLHGPTEQPAEPVKP